MVVGCKNQYLAMTSKAALIVVPRDWWRGSASSGVKGLMGAFQSEVSEVHLGPQSARGRDANEWASDARGP